MKTRIVLGVAVLLAASLSQAWANRPVFEPLFVPNELIFVLNKEPTAPNLPDPNTVLNAIYTAAGVVEKGPLSIVVFGVVVQLKPGVTFGQAFQAIQSFSFADFPGWSLRYVEPNYLVFIRWPLIGNRVFNFSARAQVGVGSSVTIGGMIVPGEFPRLVVFKVRGASLSQFGVSPALADPQMRLFKGSAPVLFNDNWTTLRDWEKNIARGVCPPPDDAREAMIVTYLDPGLYTAVVSGADGGTGIVLLEMYLLDQFMVR